jgi:hypothetical protein
VSERVQRAMPSQQQLRRIRSEELVRNGLNARLASSALAGALGMLRICRKAGRHLEKRRDRGRGTTCGRPSKPLKVCAAYLPGPHRAFRFTASTKGSAQRQGGLGLGLGIGRGRHVKGQGGRQAGSGQ